jgi:hypothetical protein
MGSRLDFRSPRLHALAADGYRALAFVAATDGDRAAAKSYLKRAISVSPAIRQSLIDDPNFS